MTQVKEIAEILRSLTKQATRGEKKIYVFGDLVTDEIKDILFKGEFRIDDQYYDLFDTWCTETCERLEYSFPPSHNFESFSELEDMIDNLMTELEGDIYTSNLTAWLHSNVNHVHYIGEAISDLGAEEGFQVLSGAQYLWKQEYYILFNTILEHLIEN